MKVAHRIGAGFGLLVALMIGALAYHTALVQQLIATQRRLSATTLRTATLAGTFERQCAAVITLTRKVSDLARTGEPTPDQPLLPDYLDKLEAERTVLGATLQELGSLQVSDPERQAIVQLLHLWRAHLAATRPWSTSLAVATATAGSPSAPSAGDRAANADHDTREDIEPNVTLALASLDRLSQQAKTLRAATDRAVADHLSASAEASEQVGDINSVVLLASLGMSLAVGFVTVRSITRPLKRLIDATRAVADGRFFYQLDASRDDELGRVAAAFNTMIRRLEAFDRMKKDFVARVSHDLRTPLVAMQETNDVLLSRLVGPLNDRQRRLVRLNRRGAKRLTARIGHLLDLSRLEAGVLELDARRHDLTALVRETLEGVEGRLSHRQIRLRGQRPDRPVWAHCDGERLIEVVENVLDNAIKFSPTGGSLAVSLETRLSPPEHLPRRWRTSLRSGPSGALALIKVADEGPGLDDTDKARIFRSFFRASDHQQPKTGGAGLGLAICHDLVRAHHGAIWVTDNPGGGCRFHILLPTQAPDSGRKPLDSDAVTTEGESAPAPPAGIGHEALSVMRQSRASRHPTVTLLIGTVLIGTVLIGAGLSACASLPSEGDRLFRAGELVAAALAYEQQLVQPGKTRVRGRAQTLYRLSLIYARPNNPSFDPVRAGRLLDRLMAEYPRSRYRPAAAVIRDLGRQLAEIERSSRARDREIAALEREGERCRERFAQPAPTPKAPPSTAADDDQRLLREQRASCHAAKDQLRAAVASRDEQITRLTGALEVLKRIDTETETGADSGG